MGLLLNCQSLSKSFGTKVLFQNLSLSVFSHNKIGLIGPNGSGKSTLLKILAGIEKPDRGDLTLKRDLKIGYVEQSCDFSDQSVQEILMEAQKDFKKPDYEKQHLAQAWLSKLEFRDTNISANHLSGGWKKRLAFARELMREPDLLLLDEPTNHLDLEGILWLEGFLSREATTYIVVSHDRYFLQNVTNRMIEMDHVYPQGLLAIDASYAQFLEFKQAFLLGQIEQERSMASKARRETKWLRSSAKARTCKSKSRVEDAHELLEDLSKIKHRNTIQRTGIDFVSTDRQTRKLLVAKNLYKQTLDGRQLFRDLEFTLTPGMRMGLLGPNGSGKTTLLRLLAGEISPDQGTIKTVDGLHIIYFDQHRKILPNHWTLRQALSPNGDFILYRGKKIHVNGWCKRFLFSPDFLDIPLEKLSGGERARISIAHLMLEPADILLLDEPTNDLDIPTLETLEESLIDFPGAIVLITHDRCMLDRICTLFLALGDPDHSELYVDLNQWKASSHPPSSAQQSKEKRKNAPISKSKLSYLEKKELEQIEGKIEKLEQEIQRLNHLLENKEIIEDSEKLNQLCAQIGLEEVKLEQLFLRWEELDKKNKD